MRSANLISSSASGAHRSKRLSLDAGDARTTAIVLFGIALIVRLLFLLISDNDDGDAYARIVISREAVDSGKLIPSQIWLPVHFWILAAPYWFGLESQLWPRLLTAFAGAATVAVVFFIARKLHGGTAGIVTATALAFHPLHVRLSIVSVTEAMFLLFLALGLLTFIRYLESGRLSDLAIGSLSLNVACGHRLEAWLIVGLLPLLGAMPFRSTARSPARPAIVRPLAFTAASCLFVLAWCTYSWSTYGDPLAISTLNAERVRDDIVYGATSAWYVIAFWPAALLATLGPIVGVLAISGCVLGLVRGPRQFAVLFVGFVTLYYIQNFRSALITDARYSMLLSFLLMMNIGSALEYMHGKMRIASRTIIGVVGACTVAWLAVVWGISEGPFGLVSAKLASVSPRPRFEAAVRTVDVWLRTQPSGQMLVVGPLSGARLRYGPWFASFEEWFPRRRIVGASSIDEAVARVRSTTRSYIVTTVNEKPETSVTLQGDSDGHLERVFSAGGYVVYEWSPGGTPTAADEPSSRILPARTSPGLGRYPEAS